MGEIQAARFCNDHQGMKQKKRTGEKGHPLKGEKGRTERRRERTPRFPRKPVRLSGVGNGNAVSAAALAKAGQAYYVLELEGSEDSVLTGLLCAVSFSK